MPTKPTHQRGAAARQLRIIAGRWRGRRWRFPDSALRPTPDRVRETLFNWLQNRVSGARCLDLFAGSGALGLEALSRGAASVVFIEQERSAARAITEQLAHWGAVGGSVACADALQFLGRAPAEAGGPFDLVFLDPPYATDLLGAAAAALDARSWLAPDALIYVEHALGHDAVVWPKRWQRMKSGAAGAVSYHLYGGAGQSPAAA
jgi:16S rRNA (guanine966-N2)-methyltransferase